MMIGIGDGTPIQAQVIPPTASGILSSAYTPVAPTATEITYGCAMILAHQAAGLPLTADEAVFKPLYCTPQTPVPGSTPGFTPLPTTGQFNSQGMPTLSPAACASNQTYIPPGGNMGNGRGITPTGACVNSAAPPPAASNSSSGSGDFIAGIPNTYLLIGAAAIGLLLVMGKK